MIGRGWLAKGFGAGAEICIVFDGPIAGKPAPTGILMMLKIAASTQNLWELACQRWGQLGFQTCA
jgi:hypothetical protein